MENSYGTVRHRERRRWSVAGKSFRIVPKIDGNLIAVYIYRPSTGESRQVALIECPTDNQMNDSMELANEFCKAYRKRLNRSIIG